MTGLTATVTGWALDPDTANPIDVLFATNAGEQRINASVPRADVAAAYPSAGLGHGFSAALTLMAGASQVCAYALDATTTARTQIGCITVTALAPVADLGRAPIGNLESVSASAGSVRVTGWALDLDTTSSINVHVYIDGLGVAIVANGSRGDIAAAYPKYGDAHGFDYRTQIAAGQHSVCAYAINNGAGGHTLLGCQQVTTS